MHLSKSTRTLSPLTVRSPAFPSPSHRKVVHSVDLHVVLETDLALVRGHAQVRQPLQQQRKHGLQFHARENLTQALMDPPAKGDVMRSIATHVERVRVGK